MESFTILVLQEGIKILYHRLLCIRSDIADKKNLEEDEDVRRRGVDHGAP